MSKYVNKKTVVDGITFASRREANRYSELRLLERAGEIQNLRLQVPYRLEVNGVLVCKYLCDFQYEEKGKEVVEDCKGMRTPLYVVKAKLMLAVHGINVLET